MKTTIANKQATGSACRHAALAALMSTLPLIAAAHDLVLVPDATGSLTVRFGHPGDWLQADRERLLDLQVQQESGPGRPLAAALVGKGLDFTAPDVATGGKAAMVSARYDNGLWVAVPDATGKPTYHNTSKAMLPKGTSTMAAIKFAKALYASDDDALLYKREVRHLIELIPQRNPAGVKPGDTLAVLVKFNGKPLANAGVEVTDSATVSVKDQPKYQTNAVGVVEVPIKRAGLNVISVDHERRNNGSLGKAMKSLPVEQIAMIATYAFQVR